jgi:hypothetical protein
MAAIVTRLINCTKSSVWIKMVSAHGIYVKLNSVLAIESLFKIISLISNMMVITTPSVPQRLSQICQNLDGPVGRREYYCFSVLFSFISMGDSYKLWWLAHECSVNLYLFSDIQLKCVFCSFRVYLLGWCFKFHFMWKKRSNQMPPIWSVRSMFRWHLFCLILADA